MYDFDLLVIGGGSGGVRAARISAGLGAKVAIVEDTHWGGTCVNVGCVPKKIYHYLASSVDDVEIASALGFDVSLGQLDWPKFFAMKEKEVLRLRSIYASLLENSGAQVIDGFARIEDKHTVAVGDELYTAKHILIAVGGEPSRPSFEGAEFALDSNQLFAMDVLPKRMLVIGGGYIASELASTFHKLGVDVDLLVRSQLLRAFDQETVEFLESELLREGLCIKKGVTPESIEQQGEALLVTFSNGEQKIYDQVLVATGRHPRFDGLGLENVNVALTDKGLIVVNDHYQSTEPSIYAVGDIVSDLTLTPVALAQGMYLARHLFANKDYIAPDLSKVATTIFTHPQMATVGASEERLKQQDVDYSVFQSTFRLMRTRITDYIQQVRIKLLVDKHSDVVLGIHMIGPECGEVMQGFAVCVQAGMTKSQFDQTIGIHPTFAEELVTMREPIR